MWIPIGSAGISVAYGNGYVMIPSYSLFAPVPLYNNTFIQHPPSTHSPLQNDASLLKWPKIHYHIFFFFFFFCLPPTIALPQAPN